MSITVRNSIVECERMLWELLSLALQRRDTPAANLAALAAYSGMPDHSLVYVASENRVYRFAKDSQVAADGLNVVQPASLPGTGRWLRVESPLTFGPNSNAPLQSRATGICSGVEIYQGDDGFEQMIERGYAKPPFLMIEFVGSEPEPLSLNPGAAYREKLEFTIHCFSRCLRAPWAAAWGSPYPQEAAQDPGIFGLACLVRYLCAGVRSGIPGIQRVEIGRIVVEYEDLDDRFFAAAVQVFVWASYEIPDEDLIPLELEAQPLEPAGRAGGALPFDRRNYVSEGLFVDPGPGLARTVPAGLAVIDGAPVASAGGPVTLPAGRDIYRDLLPDGTLVYTDVAVSAPAPAVPAGALRIAYSRTSATDVDCDVWLCSYAFVLGNPIPILPP